METELDYKGCRIKAEPLQLKESGRWSTRFFLIYKVGSETFDDLYDHSPDTFENREGAINRSIELGREIVDGNV